MSSASAVSAATASGKEGSPLPGAAGPSADAIAASSVASGSEASSSGGLGRSSSLEKRAFVTKRKLEDPLYYADYLKLDAVLGAQQLKSAEAGHPSTHELLFIITHQSYELWFKQILAEVEDVRSIFGRVPVDDRHIGIAVQRLQRVREIQNILISQISVLETMSPLDFLEFRDYLYPASGFQSAQFRLLENRLGLPASSRLSYGLRGYCTYLNEADAARVKEAETSPSLHDLVEAWLERTPFLSLGTFSFWEHYRSAVTSMLDEDERSIRANTHLAGDLILQQVKELGKQREHFASLFDEEKYNALLKTGDRRMSYRAMQAALLITLYHEHPMLTLPYSVLQALVDIDEHFTVWRYRHALMVHRQLGSKVGTGGSSGYQYLRATAERHKIFNDLTDLPTYLIPRYMVPELPAEVARSLAFNFDAGALAGAAATGGIHAVIGGAEPTVAASKPAHCSGPAPGETVVPSTAGELPDGSGAGRCPFAHMHGAGAALPASHSTGAAPPATAAAVASSGAAGDLISDARAAPPSAAAAAAPPQ